MSEPDSAKRHAARLAADLVRSGMSVGLGSGTTAAFMIRRLAERIRTEDLRFVGVATSRASAELAESVGIPLVDLDDIVTLDLGLDGADEVDPQFRLIKGHGGALLREKIVASAARRRVFIVGDDKRVDRLGARFPVPIEVSLFGLRHTEVALKAVGAETTVRVDLSGGPYVTDGGNRIIDCQFPRGIDDPVRLETQLKSIVGVFETGLFLGLCTTLIVGHRDRADLIEVG